MSNVEHYFENLLFYGEDTQGEPNKRALTPEVQDAIETCVAYVRWVMFGSDVECRDFLHATINGDVVGWAREYYDEDPVIEIDTIGKHKSFFDFEEEYSEL